MQPGISAAGTAIGATLPTPSAKRYATLMFRSNILL